MQRNFPERSFARQNPTKIDKIKIFSQRNAEEFKKVQLNSDGSQPKNKKNWEAKQDSFESRVICNVEHKNKSSSVLKRSRRPRKYVRIVQHLGIQSKNCISAKDNNITRAISTLNRNFFVRDCANITPNKNVPRQFSVSTNLFPLLRKPSFLKEFSATAVISPYFWVRASESQNNVSKEKEKFVNTVNNASKGNCGIFVPKE